MGVLPLQFLPGQNADSLGLTGSEAFSITGLDVLNHGTTPKSVTVRAVDSTGGERTFEARVRIDTPTEAEYYRHGGVIPFVLRQLAAG
jgi:aconitate hydratase